MATLKVKKATATVCNKCRHYIQKNHFCSYCSQCKKHCLCRKRAGIGTFQVPKANAASIGNSSMFIYSKRAIGLELELSNFGTWQVREKDYGVIPNGPSYKIDHDGSVTSGLEAVIEPMAGDQMIITGLNAIASHVYDNNCEVNRTCGYHVHVDARDFSWHDIQKTLFLWMRLEDQAELWKLSGRGPTTFSDSWIHWWNNRSDEKVSLDIKKFKAQVIKMLYNVDTTTYKEFLANVKNNYAYKEAIDYTKRYNNKGPEKIKYPKTVDYVSNINEHKRLKANRGWNRAVKSRYLDLNIHSWLFRGTLEYRLAAGTVDPNDIRMWPLFCLWLTEIISRTSLKIIVREVKSGKNIIKEIISRGGFPTPSITGEKIYPMPPYLLDWVAGKII